MSSPREVVDRLGGHFPLPDDAFDRLTLRRDRRRRNKRIGTVALALAISLAAAGAFARAVMLEETPADGTLPPTPIPTLAPTSSARIDWDAVPGVSVDADAFVDVRTGEVTPLPDSIASFRGSGGYAVAPGGDALLFEASADGDSRRPCVADVFPDRDCQIFVANVDGTGLRQLTDSPGGAAAGDWSPDGRMIVAVLDGDAGRNVVLVIVDVVTGETAQLAEGGAPADFWEPHFSLDGQLVLFGRFANQGSHTFGVPVEGGNARLVLEDRWNAISSPDSGTIAYSESVTSTEGTSGPQVWLADADGRRRRPLVPDEFPFSWSPSWSPDSTRIVFSKPVQDADQLVAVIDVASGTPTFTVKAPEPPAAVWIDDDTLLVDVGPVGSF